ncbi:YrhB domain-containing protein [Streptomyces sp. HNM0574]|uniref:YrhB domain-containing protein n=1 Tax=Streptomyces sp. HNM0574 TaxID=2714954 RepID=UPI00146B1FF3|nr:YrhB domain-containing protein [Streptomyces sp. HNM0574]NLU70705.1 hypothetical protein [Streptomyces sp. HNM0574]
MIPAQQAAAWLQHVYQGRVELTGPEPLAQYRESLLFGCRNVLDPRGPEAAAGAEPMLNCTVAVPRNGSAPFHPATHDPHADLRAFDAAPHPRGPQDLARQLNARGCALAISAMVDGAQATALPWQPWQEQPGWWQQLVSRYFPSASTVSCSTWDEVIRAVQEQGPRTRALVWVRREVNGHEATGTVLFADSRNGNVAFLDGQTGGLAQLQTHGIRSLAVARFQPAEADPMRQPAPDLQSAVRKATAWLESTWGPEVELVSPDAADELQRGWLFACNTRRFLHERDGNAGMLDAGFVVPKSTQAPILLPNSYPWQWLDAWDNGATPGNESMPLPPEPGPASWLPNTLANLEGDVQSLTSHTDWGQLIATIASWPRGARALVWQRRRDRRGRDSTGLVLVATHGPDGVQLIDSNTGTTARLESEGVIALHLIRYR